ncbi:MAG: hypothetical protein ACYCZM_13180 [Acidimicrobiales bacterium]
MRPSSIEGRFFVFQRKNSRLSLRGVSNRKNLPAGSTPHGTTCKQSLDNIFADPFYADILRDP